MKSLSRVQLLATPWTADYKVPPSMGFSRQEYWGGLPLPSLLSLYTFSFIHFSLYSSCWFVFRFTKCSFLKNLSIFNGRTNCFTILLVPAIYQHESTIGYPSLLNLPQILNVLLSPVSVKPIQRIFHFSYCSVIEFPVFFFNSFHFSVGFSFCSFIETIFSFFPLTYFLLGFWADLKEIFNVLDRSSVFWGCFLLTAFFLMMSHILLFAFQVIFKLCTGPLGYVIETLDFVFDTCWFSF